MEKVKVDHVIKKILAENNINVLVKDIKEAARYDIPGTFKEIYHRIIFKITLKNGTSYEIMQETTDKNGNFSLDSAVFKTKEIKINSTT